jgi:UDP-N-acetyl-alpha-D-muramoyl-L-alanyl-L-glutamate epimerase
MIAGSPYQKFLDLRKNCGIFVYESFDCEAAREGVALRFRFRAGEDFVFQPRLFFHLPGQSAAKMADPAMQSLAFHIGMVEMISYWKAFCSPIIQIEPFLLQSSQQLWWKKLFRLGLAEFFHTNGIPQPGEDIFDFAFGPEAAPLPGPAARPVAASPGPAARPVAASPGPAAGSAASPAGPDASTATPASSGGIMVPVGGGKDSVVTLETLVRQGFPVRAMVINQRGATREVLKAAGLPGESVLEVDRSIDPLLLELNARGYLNGHTPFSAMLAFVSTMAARLAGDRYIVLSNESSASEATIPGTTINHQYSKSLEFESDFRAYARSYLGAVPEYFSYLRPLNELQIAALFSRMTNYHAGFKSCNAGSKTDTWCRKCSKCLFTYIMLAPFLESRQLMEIFGGDLFSDRELTGLLDQLTGLTDSKPFDCVGTITEVNAALAFMVRQSEKQGHALPPLLQHYQEGGTYPQPPTPNNQQPTTNTQHPTTNPQPPTPNHQQPTTNPQHSGARGHDEGQLAFRRLLDDFATPHHLPEGFEQVLRRQVGTLKGQDRN